MSTQEDYASKIDKLLRKAESTDSPAEADALVAKAQELMVTYAIDEIMLAQARGVERKEEIIQDSIHYHSSYSRAMFDIGSAIARANDCKTLVTRGNDLMHTTLWIVGFESDIARVKMLNASLQIQAAGAMNSWYKTQDTTGYTARTKFKVRRQFLFSFASGLRTKLSEASNRGKDEAASHHSEGSVALVLASRKDQLETRYEQMYPNARKARGVRYNGGSWEAATAGREAGLRANVGQPSVGGSSKELGR